jgi:hypothetical protein
MTKGNALFTFIKLRKHFIYIYWLIKRPELRNIQVEETQGKVWG